MNEDNEPKKTEGWQPTRGLMMTVAGALIVSLVVIAFLIGRGSGDSGVTPSVAAETTVTPTVRLKQAAAITVIEEGTDDFDSVQNAVRSYVGGAAADLVVERLFALRQDKVIVADIETNDNVFGNKWCWIEREGDSWEVVDAIVPRADFMVADLVAEWPSASEELIEQFLASAGSQPEEATPGSSSEVYQPGKGSPERTALMDACRKYLSYEGLFIVDELKVKGDRALAVITPESGGEAVECFLARPSGSWRVSYCVYSDGGVKDGKQQYIGEYGDGDMPDSVFNEMEQWLD